MDGDEEALYKTTYGRSPDGNYTSDRLIEMCEIDLKDERKVLEAHGFAPDEWVIISYKHNLWHAMRAGDQGRAVMYQSKITVRPKKMDDISIEDIQRFFERFKPDAQPAAVKANSYSLTGKLLEICLADIHIFRETVDPNAQSAEEKLRKIIKDIIARAKSKKFWRIILVPLGDIFDVDNMLRTTTKGTQQYLTGTPYEMFETGVRLMIWIIDELRKIAPVEYIFIPGNHDQFASFCLAKTLEAHYAGVKGVTINAAHESKKWKAWGVNLIAWAHGDMPKKNIFSWLPSKARAEWGAVKYAEIHAGHTHTQTVEEKAGQVLRYLPSIADASHWEDGNGYAGNTRCTVSFVWDSRDGLMEQWFTNV